MSMVTQDLSRPFRSGSKYHPPTTEQNPAASKCKTWSKWDPRGQDFPLPLKSTASSCPLSRASQKKNMKMRTSLHPFRCRISVSYFDRFFVQKLVFLEFILVQNNAQNNVIDRGNTIVKHLTKIPTIHLQQLVRFHIQHGSVLHAYGKSGVGVTSISVVSH